MCIRDSITVHLPTPRATGTPSTAGGIAFSPELQQQQRQQELSNLSMNDEAVAPNIAVTAATGVSSGSNHALAEQSFITVEDSLAKYDDALNRTGSTLRDFTTNLDTSMSLSSALAAGPGLVPANYVLPGGQAAHPQYQQHAVGDGYLSLIHI